MLKKIAMMAAMAASVTAVYAEGLIVESPDGKLVVETDVYRGVPYYTVTYDGKTMIDRSPLGFVSNVGDFTKGFKVAGFEAGHVEKSYDQDKIKKSHIDYKANTLTVNYESADQRTMGVEWQVSNNDIAFRYIVPKQGETASMIINQEATGFVFPESTTTFLTPQSDAMIGWKRTKPSYEEYYTYDAPLQYGSQYGHGYTFPALFRIADDGWVLLSETGVDGYYCASHLSDYVNGKYTIAYPMPEENNGNGSAAPGIALPGKTPWRTITVGADLAPIVETTIAWDVVEPRYQTAEPARPGKGTWSWILWQDNSINYDDQVTFIDFAADMGYDNVLIDNFWDTNIGTEKMEELIKYAHSKGVNPILWYSSSGHWNDITQGPVNRMDRPIVRKQWMRWMRDNGVKGIKVDFFGGDKQETMRLYEDILSDAADHGIDVIFHGCTMPRGWERMYPNYVGSEAVLASENLVFQQSFADMEAMHAATHPFIRNATGIMEYGGTMLNRRLNRGNDGGSIRRTGDALQLATAVLFQNPVQNFALAPNNLQDAPAEAIEYMKAVPTTWDDVKLIDGYPGKYVVLARRHGDSWYIAGVNGDDKAMKLTLDLTPYVAEGQQATLYRDIDPATLDMSVVPPKKLAKLPIDLPVNCGFVIVVK